jgi:hypothetical protein
MVLANTKKTLEKCLEKGSFMGSVFFWCEISPKCEK